MKQGIRVLLADDEKEFVLNVAAILKGRGFDVSTVFDGYEAVRAVKFGQVFDVVVMDLRMPGMDGLTAMKEIKRVSPDTQVIMLTGHGSLSTGIQAIREGAYDYLMKPYDMEDLVEKIKEAHETEAIRRHPVLWPRKLVGQIALCPFRRLRPQDTLFTAVKMMSRAPGEEVVEEAYVLDEGDRLRGVVTKRALVEEARKTFLGRSLTWQDLQGNPELLPKKTAAEVMQRYWFAAAPNAYLTDVANQMIVHNVRFMPVVRAGRMLGIIRLQDILQYVEEEAE